VCPELTVFNIYILSFRIFEQLALALKTKFALKIFKPGLGWGCRLSRPPLTSYAYANNRKSKTMLS